MVRGYGAPYGQYGNRPYKDITILPLPPVYGCGRGQGTTIRRSERSSIRRVRDTVYHTVSLPLIPIIKNAANGANSSASAKNGQKPQKAYEQGTYCIYMRGLLRCGWALSVFRSE